MILRHDLAVVFCSFEPDAASQFAQIPRVDPVDPFWPAMARYGLVPENLSPRDWERLPEFGIGHVYLSEGNIPSLIREYQPRVVALFGPRVARQLLGPGVQGYGLQVSRFESSQVFVFPSRPRPEHWKDLRNVIRPWLPDISLRKEVLTLGDLRHSAQYRPSMYLGSQDERGFLEWLRMLLSDSLEQAQELRVQRIDLKVGREIVLEDDGPPWNERSWHILHSHQDSPVVFSEPFLCAAFCQQLRFEAGRIRLRLGPQLQANVPMARGLLGDLAVLYPGLKLTLQVLQDRVYFHSPGGLADWVHDQLYCWNGRPEVWRFQGALPGGRVEGAFAFAPGLETVLRSFVNGRRTPRGGSHLLGLIQGVQLQAPHPVGLVGAVACWVDRPRLTDPTLQVDQPDWVRPIREMVAAAVETKKSIQVKGGKGLLANQSWL